MQKLFNFVLPVCAVAVVIAAIYTVEMERAYTVEIDNRVFDLARKVIDLEKKIETVEADAISNAKQANGMAGVAASDSAHSVETVEQFRKQIQQLEATSKADHVALEVLSKLSAGLMEKSTRLEKDLRTINKKEAP